MKIIMSTEDKMVETQVGDATIMMPTSSFRILDISSLLEGDEAEYVDVEVYRSDRVKTELILSTIDTKAPIMTAEGAAMIPESHFRIQDISSLLEGDEAEYVDVEVYRGADDIMAEMGL